MLLPVKNGCYQNLARIQDWPISVFNAVTDKHKAALAICVLTGARPSEIAQGVEIELVKKGASPFLKLRIKGSKVTEHSGQPERMLIVAIDSDAARHLVRCVETGNSTIRTHPANLCAATIKAGRKAFPNLKESVTPYVFCHHLASQMKAAGLPRRLLKALGIEPVKVSRCTDMRSVRLEQVGQLLLSVPACLFG